MNQHLPPKNKVSLSDYNYKQDLEMRLFLAELTEFQWRLLQEIVDGSLKQRVEELADLLDVDEKDVEPGLEFFLHTKLFKREGKTLLIDKERRRAFERQLIKFDPDFQPNLIYFQTLLNQVPIHVIPNWYDIPKTTDHIFSSIIEKFWSTPKAYESYSKALKFEELLLNQIVHRVFSDPEFKVAGKDLLKEFHLEREKLEECLMVLEYNMLVCLSYELKEGIWEEIVTPFYEWREYLLELKEKLPHPFKEQEEVKETVSSEAFVLKIWDYLQAIYQKELIEIEPMLLDKLIEMEWVKKEGSNVFILTSEGKKLVEKEKEAALESMKALFLRYPPSFSSFSDKDVRELERSLRPFVKKGWLFIEEWIKGLNVPLGDKKGYRLETKGKKWRFQKDVLEKKEELFIKDVIQEHFLTSGIIHLGELHGKPCLKVSLFGKKMLT